MHLLSIVKPVLGHSATHVAGAFLAMGAWAFVANITHPLPDALLAACVQGTLSALITLVMKKALEALSTRFSPGGAAAGILMPPAIVWTVSTSVLVVCHLAARTPEILATIAVPASISLTYAVIYSISLWHQRRVAA